MFTSDRRDGNRMNVYVMNPDGSGVRNISDSRFEDTHASWSRDGRFVLFTRIDRGSAEIYRVGANGGDAQQLTKSGAFDSGPVERPTGRSAIVSASLGGS
jgi:TolB protein